jgi:hypothetical protein
MDAIANAELEVKVKATDAKLVVNGIEKVANRVTKGILLASLILASALMMRVDTPWRLFGYPGLAMLCFFASALSATLFLYSIYREDRRNRKHPA